jgi:hypothetical protein
MKKSFLAISFFFAMFSLAHAGGFGYIEPGSSEPVIVASDNQLMTANELDAAIESATRKIQGSIKKSRNIEHDHHFISQHENKNHYDALAKQIDGRGRLNVLEHELAKERANNIAWILGGIILLTAIITIVVVILSRRRSVREIVTAINNNAPVPPVVAPAAPPVAAPVAAPAVAPAPVDLAEARANDRHEELVNLITNSTRQIIAEVPAAIRRLEPMIISFTDVSGHSVTYTPPIVNEGGVEMYLTPYVPSSVTLAVANPAQIARVRLTDKGDVRRSTRRALAVYFAATAPGAVPPATEQQRQQIVLVNYLRNTPELVIA